MDVVSPVMYDHLSAIGVTEEGGLFLAASNLTRQYWMGQLWYFQKAEAAPDIKQASAVAELDVGICDIACVASKIPKVLGGLDSGAIQIFELQEENLNCTGHVHEHDNYVSSVHVCADQTKAISASVDNRIKLWDLQEFRSVATLRGHSDAVFTAVPHPTETQMFVSCSQDGRLLLWDMRLPKPASILEHWSSESVPTCVSWQPGSSHSMVVGKECGTLLCLDCRSGQGEPVQERKEKPVHNRPITCIAFSHHRTNVVATGSEDCSAAVCQIGSDCISILRKEKRHKDFVRDVAWNPQTNELYTCSYDSQLLRSSFPDESVENVNEKVRQMDVVECSS